MQRRPQESSGMNRENKVNDYKETDENPRKMEEKVRLRSNASGIGVQEKNGENEKALVKQSKRKWSLITKKIQSLNTNGEQMKTIISRPRSKLFRDLAGRQFIYARGSDGGFFFFFSSTYKITKIPSNLSDRFEIKW